MCYRQRLAFLTIYRHVPITVKNCEIIEIRHLYGLFLDSS
ncbi:hypothetical protein HMPREF3191_00947 [Veillonellaceae bacterium DNF00626]|nr:hypothetical protein HMPREF3191_00947 [Veillonellaceae bacterium DNF00626]